MPWKFSRRRNAAEMHGAAAYNGLHLLKLATRQQLNVEDGDGRTPGLVAAEKGNLDALKIIHKRGGHLGKPDLLGNTALHLAAKNGHIDCVMYLLQKECCNPYSQDNDSHTALESAKEMKLDEMFKCIEGMLLNLESAKGAKWVEKMKKEAAVDGHVRQIKFYQNLKKRQNKLVREMNRKQPMRTKSMTDYLESAASGQSVLLQSSSSGTNFSDILMKKRANVKSSWIDKRRKKDFFERSQSVENFGTQTHYLSDASTSSISTNSNALVKGRPVIGHDIASALSRLQPESIARSEEDFFSSLDSEIQEENVNILSEDPFTYCQEPVISETDDKEKLRFFLECYGAGDLFPELINQGFTYEELEDGNPAKLDRYKIHSSAKKTLIEALKTRQNFKHFVEPGPLVDIFL